MPDKKIVIVLPTYNEKENLENLVKEIFSLNISGLWVIVVDDNSPDGTGKIADRLSGQLPVKVIHRSQKMGLGSAYRQAFAGALERETELFFEMDADFSHHPKYLPQFLQEIDNGYDLVIGSRRIAGGRIEGWGPLRQFASRGAMWFSRVILGLKTRDVTSGFRCYSRKAIKALNLLKIKSNGYAWQEETLYRCEKAGLRVKEIPIVFCDRLKGKSKLSKKEIISFFATIIRLKLKK